eukprot:4105413-Pyramimonas_sp.AAC.1
MSAAREPTSCPMRRARCPCNCERAPSGPRAQSGRGAGLIATIAFPTAAPGPETYKTGGASNARQTRPRV